MALAAGASADPAKIITQPTNLSPEEGTATSLSAEVSGSPNTYSWHRANGIRDAGNNEIAADTILVVQVKQEGDQAEPPVVTLEEGDGVIIINTSSGSLQTAPSVIGPWENVAAPLQLNFNKLGVAGFFRAAN
ncbi:MAG: hypothetical protein ACJAX6_001648 [Limisphaerales bacterium]